MGEFPTGSRILLVEDESLIGLAERRLLSAAGYSVELAPSGESALDLVRAARFDLVLMDINLGAGIDGGAAARRIREGGGPPVVFLSSHSEETALSKTRDSGGYGYIIKGSGDRFLLASVRMALGLAWALRGLAENEERWKSLARTAPDLIFSIGPERKVLFINRPTEGRQESDFLGKDLADEVIPEDREAFIGLVERVFREGITAHHYLRSPDWTGAVRRYDLYLGPVREGARVVSATVLIRDVTDESRLALGEPLDEARKAVEVRAAMAGFDFAPVRELLDANYGLSGIRVSIVMDQIEIYASAPMTRACRDFHRASPETLALCGESDRRFGFLPPETTALGYTEHRCANGLHDISLPLVVEGVHWGTLFLGQFIYEDDEPPLTELVARAQRYGWETEDYLGAIRELPRYSRERMAGVVSFFGSLGRIVTSLAYGAFKERVLSRRNAATAAALGESDARYRQFADAVHEKALADKDRLYAELQHRVKNSLALIVSLLSLEADSIEDDGARAPLEEAQVRIRSIGLLYEQLYRTRSVEDIDLGTYLAEVARTVVESPLGQRGLRLEADCENFRIATDRAVPAGLLLYELVANAVKHAFPAGEVGRIRLAVRLEAGMVLLRLEDDGVGLEPGFELESGGGLGSLLIIQLAAQLGGGVKAGVGMGGAGAGFDLRFPLVVPS